MRMKIFDNSIDKKVREYLLNDPEIREQLERLQAKIVDKYMKEKYGVKGAKLQSKDRGCRHCKENRATLRDYFILYKET